jgi:hypothetical protein
MIDSEATPFDSTFRTKLLTNLKLKNARPARPRRAHQPRHAKQDLRRDDGLPGSLHVGLVHPKGPHPILLLRLPTRPPHHCRQAQAAQPRSGAAGADKEQAVPLVVLRRAAGWRSRVSN